MGLLLCLGGDVRTSLDQGLPVLAHEELMRRWHRLSRSLPGLPRGTACGTAVLPGWDAPGNDGKWPWKGPGTWVNETGSKNPLFNNMNI